MVYLMELQVKAEEDAREILQLQPRNRNLSYLIWWEWNKDLFIVKCQYSIYSFAHTVSQEFTIDK